MTDHAAKMTKLQHWAIRRAEALKMVPLMHTEEGKLAMEEVVASYDRMFAVEGRKREVP